MYEVYNEMYKEIGSKIREARSLKYKHKKVSQTELAKPLGVTFQQVQKYENGYNKVPLDKLLLICNYLNQPIDFFLNYQNLGHQSHLSKPHDSISISD